MAALFVYYIIFSVFTCFFVYFIAITKRDLKIANLKTKLNTKKFWIKHYKNQLKDLEELCQSQKMEIATLNDSVNALEDEKVELETELYGEEEEEEDEEEAAYLHETIEAKGYKN